MRIMGTGLNYRTGELMVKPMDSKLFAEKLWKSLDRNSSGFKTLTNIGREALTFRGEIKCKPIDLGNPKEAGWTYIVNEKDPQKEEISKILQPLAEA